MTKETHSVCRTYRFFSVSVYFLYHILLLLKDPLKSKFLLLTPPWKWKKCYTIAELKLSRKKINSKIGSEYNTRHGEFQSWLTPKKICRGYKKYFEKMNTSIRTIFVYSYMPTYISWFLQYLEDNCVYAHFFFWPRLESQEWCAKSN